MKVYQVEKDEYEYIYAELKRLPGITYVGSLPQRELAHQLATVETFAYPNIFAETSCIAVMEAMAAGLHVVTSDLGALPETTAGFADLIPILGRTKEEYVHDFIEAILRPISKENIRQQIQFVLQHYTWKQKVKEWEKLLRSLAE
jgi:glycosyltransferase involved in cell wall biosynthesis